MGGSADVAQPTQRYSTGARRRRRDQRRALGLLIRAVGRQRFLHRRELIPALGPRSVPGPPVRTSVGGAVEVSPSGPAWSPRPDQRGLNLLLISGQQHRPLRGSGVLRHRAAVVLSRRLASLTRPCRVPIPGGALRVAEGPPGRLLIFQAGPLPMVIDAFFGPVEWTPTHSFRFFWPSTSSRLHARWCPTPFFGNMVKD